MNGIVSLLDEQHYALVEQIWAELQQRLGLRGVYVTPYPHFSYHVARDYQLDRLEPLLARLAAGLHPLTVTTAGLGIFTGEQPVLYLPVARSPELDHLHGLLWREVSGTATEAEIYYAPSAGCRTSHSALAIWTRRRWQKPCGCSARVTFPGSCRSTASR